MKRRPIIIALLLGLSSILGFQTAAAQAGADEAALERRLQRLQDRMGSPGSGLLAHYRASILRLENTLHKGEYRQFHAFVRDEVVKPWREVNKEAVLQLHSTPPPQLTSNQRAVIRRNATLVQKINNRLRRVRRLVTRVEKQHDDMRRQALELRKLRRQYGRMLVDLEKVSPESARIYRDWLESSFHPRLEPLRDRERAIREKVEQLLRWTEDPALHEMLKVLRDVNAALRDLRRLYAQSLHR
jgi:hypothetical protein